MNIVSDAECFGYGNPLAFIPQIFIPLFHPFQMGLHEFFMISFLSGFFYWNFVFTTIGIENRMQWQKASVSIKINIAQCTDAFDSWAKKGNCLINRSILNSHARILCSPDLWVQPMNKAMAKSTQSKWSKGCNNEMKRYWHFTFTLSSFLK